MKALDEMGVSDVPKFMTVSNEDTLLIRLTELAIPIGAGDDSQSKDKKTFERCYLKAEIKKIAKLCENQSSDDFNESARKFYGQRLSQELTPTPQLIKAMVDLGPAVYKELAVKSVVGTTAPTSSSKLPMEGADGETVWVKSTTTKTRKAESVEELVLMLLPWAVCVEVNSSIKSAGALEYIGRVCRLIRDYGFHVGMEYDVLYRSTLSDMSCRVAENYGISQSAAVIKCLSENMDAEVLNRAMLKPRNNFVKTPPVPRNVLTKINNNLPPASDRPKRRQPAPGEKCKFTREQCKYLKLGICDFGGPAQHKSDMPVLKAVKQPEHPVVK
jgi:hypothetical protein